MNTSADLLKELRIDRKAPPPEPTSRRGLWITLLLLLVVGALLRGWMLFQPITADEANGVVRFATRSVNVVKPVGM